ncbi:MAG: T9SS type A sorting domain-containing protein [Bacteroidales bacterium]|nr:T9SS type A sorting domain-containing protein [Bacteroidales bacterium]
MKKLFLLVFLAIFANTAFTQSMLPNGDMENWYPVIIPGTATNYEDLGVDMTDNWLTTLNSLNAVPAPIGPGPVTVFKTDDKYSGTYAAKLVSQTFVMTPFDVFIPGMLGTATLDFQNVRAILGRSCPGWKPTKLQGYFKFEPVNGDSCAAVILLSKWNSTTLQRDTVGYGKLVTKDTVSTYTRFEVPVDYSYPSSNLSPDSITILTVSSAGFNVISFMYSIGQPGSTMYVDDLSLEYPAGIEQSLMPETSITMFPNPANETLTVTLGKTVENGILEIFDVTGKMISTMDLTGKLTVLPVYSLSNGAYFIKIKEGSRLLNTGSFIVRK